MTHVPLACIKDVLLEGPAAAAAAAVLLCCCAINHIFYVMMSFLMLFTKGDPACRLRIV